VLERSTGGWNWEKVAEVVYTVDGDTMVVTIPRAALGISEGDFTVNFKWSDNMQKDGDIMEFYVSGDVAPGARFKYSFTSLSASVEDPETSAPSETETVREPESVVIGTDDETETVREPGSFVAETGIETQPSEDKGCRSAVGATCVGTMVAAAAAVALRKKKEEE